MSLPIKILVYAIASCLTVTLCYFVGTKIGQAFANKNNNKEIENE